MIHFPKCENCLQGAANVLDQVDPRDADVLGRERRHHLTLRAPPVPLGTRAGRRPEVHVVITREGTPEEQILSTFDGDLILEACRFQIQTPDSFCFLLHFELNPGGYRKKFQIPSKKNLKVRFRNQLTSI